MTIRLNLGVADVPYTVAPGENASQKGAPVTTGDVAGWLENKYGVMGHFYEANKDGIAKDLAESVAGALESVLMGAPADTVAPYAAATTKIEASFRHFLDADTLASMGVPGVPTAAAKKGVNHRLKSKKGAERPSFIDTGQYQASMRVWTD